MDLQDLRRIVEERNTGSYNLRTLKDTYEVNKENIEQHKLFKLMLRYEVLKRFKNYVTDPITKINIRPYHTICYLDPKKEDNYSSYRYIKKTTPKNVSYREGFDISIEILIKNGTHRWNAERHTIRMEFSRHSKNMNWKVSEISCSKREPGTYNNTASEPMIFLAKELEGIFGIEESEVEKKYVSFKEKFEEAVE